MWYIQQVFIRLAKEVDLTALLKFCRSLFIVNTGYPMGGTPADLFGVPGAVAQKMNHLVISVSLVMLFL